MNMRWDPEKRRIYQREYIKREAVRAKRREYQRKYRARLKGQKP